MDPKFRIIDQLSGLKAAGIISPEQDEQLSELLASDPEASEFNDAQVALGQSAEINQIIAEHDAPSMLYKVWEGIDKENRRRKVIKIRRTLSIAAAAAIIFGIAIGGIAILLPKKQDINHLSAVNEAKSRIELRLPNGQVVDLSARQGQVNTAGATFSNNNKTLTYTPTGAVASSNSTLLVPIGKDYTIALSDGTTVHLNSSTSITFPLSFADRREVTINGEAYLEVAPDAKRPFIVHLPNASVQVLGTAFNVNTYDPGISRVALVSGKVTVKDPSANTADPVMLKPGVQAVATNKEVLVQPFDPSYTLSWRQGIFRFQDLSLSKICEVLPRWFGISAVMDNDRIANFKFSGGLSRNMSLKEQLSMFQLEGQVEYYWDKDSTLHFK